MTQEELDAMMSGDDDIESMEIPESDSSESGQGTTDDAPSFPPPPPPTDDHKVVYQLDDVTRESEEKAGEVFDQLEVIGESAGNLEGKNADVIKTLEANITLFKTLQEKFPNIESFNKALEDNEAALAQAKEVTEDSMSINDNTIMIMDIMQYQDIHRQKIERVINVMRALSNYMNTLLEGQVDDESRVSSAKHIEGDDNSDVVGNDDIEALIASFGG
jgi:chemotaxis regulatin CheY-phosphate phosphatase CheZ